MPADESSGLRGGANPVSVPRLFGRALRLRCPRCGGPGVFASWFAMKERCPRCGIPLARGEAQDYWLGGMMFNIVLSELLAVLIAAVVIVLTWPRVPWTGVWIGAIALMIAAPFALFPWSRTLWLAFDLMFRPKHESHYR